MIYTYNEKLALFLAARIEASGLTKQEIADRMNMDVRQLHRLISAVKMNDGKIRYHRTSAEDYYNLKRILGFTDEDFETFLPS